MSKGGSYGGGQSSLGYLFGSDKSPSSPGITIKESKPPTGDLNSNLAPSTVPSPRQTSANNYYRAQGQNTGNFITDRPTTKVQSVPGGDSSLDYLFGNK